MASRICALHLKGSTDAEMYDLMLSDLGVACFSEKHVCETICETKGGTRFKIACFCGTTEVRGGSMQLTSDIVLVVSFLSCVACLTFLCLLCPAFIVLLFVGTNIPGPFPETCTCKIRSDGDVSPSRVQGGLHSAPDVVAIALCTTCATLRPSQFHNRHRHSAHHDAKHL